MAKTLKISLETGEVEIPGLPSEETPGEERNQRTLALVAEVVAELDALEPRVGEEPREVLKQAWILRSLLDAHPRSWITNRGERRTYNDVSGRIDKLKELASQTLPDGVGKQVWEDLPYIQEALRLLHGRLRVAGDVQRLILSPLGKLEFCEINYQRRAPEEITRVCQELDAEIRRTAELDDDVARWGPQNHAALLARSEPTSIPQELEPSKGGAPVLFAVAAVLLVVGGVLAAKLVPGVDRIIGILVAAAAVVPIGIGVTKLSQASGERALLPGQFQEMAKRFRERLYLICVLRTLYRYSSRYSRAQQAFKGYLQAQGGQQRWKRVKFEDRDLTELFASETWDERGTVERWLGEKVTEVFRLESNKLEAPEALDAETWDILLKAYLLESFENAGELGAGRLLDTVTDLLFTHRGENVEEERTRVFAQVRKAWAER